jgi:hypothetical protein
MLKTLLGREMTLAYLVETDARQPRLSFHTEQRAAVETVGARIGLAETTLVLDANGAYRAQQVLHVDNSTEQFLEIRLPEGADLWTARVAGEAVKPTVVAGAADRGSVRIPLIKTAPGDLDYEVVLKYGGRMPAIGALRQVAFPLIRCQNIHEDLSQVRLFLPDKYRWFDFGGTMRLVAGEAELQAGYLRFQTKQTEQIVANLRQGDAYTKLRAAANLKSQEANVQQFVETLAPQTAVPSLRSELQANTAVRQQAQQEAKQLEQSSQRSPIADNRLQLNNLFQTQKGGRARNVVSEFEANWSDAGGAPHAGEPGRDQPQAFDAEWLRRNQLASDSTRKQAISESSKKMADVSRTSTEQGRIGGFGGQGKAKINAPLNVPNQPSAADVGLAADRKSVDSSGLLQLQEMDAASIPYAAGKLDSTERYKQRLEQKAGQPEAKPPEGVLQHRMLPRLGGQGGQPAAGRTLLGVEMIAQPSSPPAAGPAAMAGVDLLARTMRPQTVTGPSSSAEEGQAVAPPAEVDATVKAAVPPPATGLASLDFELPTRGVLVRFTVPRGEAEITARAFSGDLWQRFWQLALVAFAALLIWLAASWAR